MMLRRAGVADVAVVAAIDAASGMAPDDHPAPLIAEWLALGESWIAEVDGTPVGYALVSRRFFSRPFVHLLAVATNARRAGVGTTLMARCAEVHDDDRLFTSTNQSNRAMQALLAKAGFEPSGMVDNLDPGDPELFYVKWRGVSPRG